MAIKGFRADRACRWCALAIAATWPVLAGAQPASVPTVTVTVAQIHLVRQTALFVGSLVAREEIQVGIDLDGYRVDSILADAGDVVAAGQVLARLSTEWIDVQLAQNAASLARSDAAAEQARNQVEEAQANEVQAIAALQRSQPLQSRGVVSQGSLDLAVAAAGQSTARRKAAEQALAAALADKSLIMAQRSELTLRRAKTEIRAPAGGLILTRTLRIGSIVGPTTGPLFTIAKDQAVELAAEVPEARLASIRPGQRAWITQLGTTGAVEAQVRWVSPTIDPTTRLGTAKIALPSGSPFRVGGFAQAEIELASQSAVALPPSALVGGGEQRTAQIVVGGKIETRALRLGISSGDLTAVTDGIAPGDKVVLRAGPFVRAGEAVATVDASEAAATP